MEEPIRGGGSVPSVFDTGERDAVSPSGGGERCDRGQRKDPKQLPHGLLLVAASSTARQRPEVPVALLGLDHAEIVPRLVAEAGVDSVRLLNGLLQEVDAAALELLVRGLDVIGREEEPAAG